MSNFWDYKVWGGFNLVAVLLISLILANGLKRVSKTLRRSLIPTSVLAGLFLLILSVVVRRVTGTGLFDLQFFGDQGISALEILTYHALALGFIASTFRSKEAKFSKRRRLEIVQTGMTTVSSYLMQGIAGLFITLVASLIMRNFFPAAGILLPFGYGQGTGQALNYGSIFETDYDFTGGRSFGLTIAALGFLSASIGGVFFLNILKKKGLFAWKEETEEKFDASEVHPQGDIPMNGGIDKLTVEIGLVAATYFLTYLFLYLIGSLLPGLRSVIYGFNFLFGVLMAILLRTILDKLRKAGVIKREYRNSFMMHRLSNFFFDIMVVAGIAAIRLEAIKSYWGVIIVLAVAGLVLTWLYNRFIANTLFPDYRAEQFLMMYGMLTGTASTGIMLLREADPEFKTPAADNLVYQNFPAMVLGFPMMLLATLAPKRPLITLLILIVFFLVLNAALLWNHLMPHFRKGKAKDA